MSNHLLHNEATPPIRLLPSRGGDNARLAATNRRTARVSLRGGKDFWREDSGRGDAWVEERGESGFGVHVMVGSEARLIHRLVATMK